MRLLESSEAASRSPAAIPAAALAAGIFVDGSIVPLSAFAWAIGACLAAGATFGFRRFKRRSLSTVALAAGIVCLGGFWHHYRWNLTAPDDLSLEASEEPAPLAGRFRLLDSPRELPPSRFAQPDDAPFWKVAVEALAVRDGSAWRDVGGTGTLIFPFDGRVGSAGDMVEVRGLLATLPPPKNPGEPDWRTVARGDGETFIVRARFPESIQVVARGSGVSPAAWLEAARDRVERLFFETLSPDSAAAATALIVGRRDRMEREARDAFFLTGTVHLLAISGMHVSALILGLRFLGGLAGLSGPRRDALLIAATAAFTIFAYAQAPVLRAATLILFAGVADFRGRRMPALQGLSIAALIVLIWRPWDLFDAGAQLSFLAVAALAWHGEVWAARSKRRRDTADRTDAPPPTWKRWTDHLSEIALRVWTAGACVWLATLPLVEYRFHLVSFSAVPFNPVYGLIVAVALYAAAASIPLRLLFGTLASPVSWLADWSLATLAWTLDLTCRLPYSFFWTAGPSAGSTLLFYAAVPAILIGVPGRRQVAAFAILLGVWMASSATDAASRRQVDSVRVTTLAVGHASAVLIETDEGALLCDAGFGGSPRSGARIIAGALWNSGRTHLDAVVLSHRDMDHFNALGELTRLVSIGVVYVPETFFEEDAGLAGELRQLLEAEGIPWRPIVAGDAIVAGEGGSRATISVLHPAAGFRGAEDNEASVTLLVESDGQRLLLPGDLEGAGLEALFSLDLPPIDVTVAPHHGSLGSAPETFAERTRASVVIVSGDDQERWDEFAAAWSGSDARLFLTERDGAVRAELLPEGPRVRTFRADPW